MPIDQQLADSIRDSLIEVEGLSEKKMFGGLCFLINGNMACGLTGMGDLMLRVGPALENLLSKPHAREMDFTGRPMKGFVFVGQEGWSDENSLKEWTSHAVKFAQSLPPKN
jgi:hypothetical protein